MYVAIIVDISFLFLYTQCAHYELRAELISSLTNIIVDQLDV